MVFSSSWSADDSVTVGVFLDFSWSDASASVSVPVDDVDVFDSPPPPLSFVGVGPSVTAESSGPWIVARPLLSRSAPPITNELTTNAATITRMAAPPMADRLPLADLMAALMSIGRRYGDRILL